jgi:hypothetical protein
VKCVVEGMSGFWTSTSEVESRYTPKPLFAGGTDPRKHLTMQLEVPAEVAGSLVELDAAVCAASSARVVAPGHRARRPLHGQGAHRG